VKIKYHLETTRLRLCELTLVPGRNSGDERGEHYAWIGEPESGECFGTLGEKQLVKLRDALNELLPVS
jgi:hypothetical protein